MDTIDIFFLRLQLEEVPEIELTCIPEEIYYQVTELEMELPFDV